MKRPKTSVAVATIVLGLVLAACGSGGSGDSDASSELRIAATGVDSLPFMAVLEVAEEKGWFKEEGLDVTFTSGSGGGNTLRTLSTGDADIAIAGGPAVVQAAEQSNGGIKVIAPWFQVNDFHWIAPASSNIDIKNASLGVTGAGSTTQLLGEYMKETTLPGIEVVELGGGMGDSWAAARGGSIDAGWAMHPFVTDKEKNEDAENILSARDEVGDFPADMVATSADFASNNGKALKAFFRVAERVNNYVIESTDDAAKELSPILNIDDVGMLSDALRDTPDMKKAYSLNVDKKALETLSDLLVSNDVVSNDVNWHKMLDQSYLPKDARADF